MTSILSETSEPSLHPASVVTWCKEYIAKAVDIPISDLDEEADLDSIGLDSAITTSMLLDMEEWLGMEIPPSVLFENSSLSAIARDVVQRLSDRR